MLLDVTVLTVAVVFYGAASLLFADGATAGLRAALTHPRWLIGLAVQTAAFGLAFVARRDLPLLVVQPATTAAVAVTCVLGVLLRRWRLTRVDVVALVLVVAGVAALGFCAQPGPADVPAWPVLLGLALVLALVAAEALRSVRRHAPTGAVALWIGTASGVAFGVGAVAARALAGDPLGALRTGEGLAALGLLAVGTTLGQLLYTASMSGGAVAGPSSTMHVAETVGPALVGVAWLGDAVVPGRWPLVVLSTVVALVGSVLLVGHGTHELQEHPVA